MPKQSRNQINEEIKRAEDWRALYLGRADDPKTRDKLRRAVDVREQTYTSEDRAATQAMAEALGLPRKTSAITMLDYATQAIPQWPSLKVAHFIDFLWKPTLPPRGFIFDRLEDYCAFWRDEFAKERKRLVGQHPIASATGVLLPGFDLGRFLAAGNEPQSKELKGGEMVMYLLPGGRGGDSKRAGIQLSFDEDMREQQATSLYSLLAKAKHLDEVALKAVGVIFSLCYETNPREPSECVFDFNQHLDRLGYRRDKHNRHYSNNKKKVEQAIMEVAKTFWNVKIKQPRHVKKDIKLDLKGPIFTIETEAEVSVEGKTVAKALSIRLHSKIVKQFGKGLYTWQGNNLYLTDISDNGYPHLIRVAWYLNVELFNSYKKEGGQIRRPLYQIVREVNIPIPKDNKRLVERMDRIFAHLVEIGQFKSIKRVKEASPVSQPLTALYEITIADDHNTRRLLRLPGYEKLNNA